MKLPPGHPFGEASEAVPESKTSEIKRFRVWIGYASLAIAGVFVFYWLSAPFIIPHIYKNSVAMTIYRPALNSIQRQWFGEELADWYFYRVCKMPILFSKIIEDE
ncbi:MAG: hypothetical protein JWM68_1309 [Verrucomicrobiales bacterium]|nr:hypothetical protein [Verrucomicrobiales bacterium]